VRISADLLQAMPDHLRLFSALYAYDLVGFQTQRDADRFQTYLRLFGGGRAGGDERALRQAAE